MEKRRLIKENPFFSFLPPDALEWVVERLKEREFKEGEEIVRENEPGDKFYIIKKGKAQVLRRGKEIAVLEKGDFFGEMALIEEKERSATIKALTPLAVLEIDKETFLSMLEKYPKAALEILKVLSARVRDTNRKMIEHLLHEERLATIGKMAETVIHDLKGPISVIKGYTGLLRRRDLTHKEREEFLSIVSQQTEVLLQMIEDVLEFARGRQHLKPVRLNLLTLVKETVDPMREELASENVVVDVKGEDVEAEVDPLKLRRALQNLIGNARDAMEEGGRIDVNVKKEGRYAVVEVKDTGKGMPPEVLSRLFEPFFTHGKSGGTGLGMTIVKKIVEDHDGKIEVESEVDKGTTVRIYLPL